MTAIDASSEQRAALARELQWLAGILPLGNGSEIFDGVADDRVAAIVATALLGLPSQAADEAITRALAAVGLQRGVDRAFYYELNETTASLTLAHEWHAPTVRPMKPVAKFARIPVDVLPQPFLASLRRGGVVRVPRTHQFLATSVEKLVAADGDRALALVPVVVDGVLIGIAGFAARVGTVWEQGDLDLLHLVAQGVARTVERKRVDGALLAAEARFRAMCDASPLGIFIAGEKGQCLYINPAGEAIMGLTYSESLGHGWMSALHPDDRERVAARWGSAVETRSAYKTPIHRFVHKNGEVRSVEVRALPIAGQPHGLTFVGILEDVTVRIQNEQERQDLLARTEAARQEAEAARADVAAILSRISDAFIALDRDGRFTYANERAMALCGHSRDQMIGQVAWTTNPQLAEGPLRPAFERAVAEQRAITVETQCCGRPFEVRLYPSPTGVSFFFEDISDRRRHEEQLTSDRDYLRRELEGGVASEIVGSSSGIRHMKERVAMVAGTNTTVLITGETGTGKELVARAIHEASPRHERLLVKVNCAAISAGLVESELFGHEKGAFTGAVGKHKGRFELAHGGTLFLDEIGELPLETQVKLLRVLQEREFERVGGNETIRVDVRVVAATNRNLPQLVARGQFREDLYYRLNVFPVALPPLRERAEDIPPLVNTFLARYARQAGKRIEEVSPEAMWRLLAYKWPGNVRELQNVIERAVVFARHRVLDLDALPDLSAPPSSPLTVAAAAAPTDMSPPRTIAEVERWYVEQVLTETRWVIEGERGAARRLGLHPNTLRSRLKRWGVMRPHNAN
ncbi:MAG TPA: sigma 54-interacting transcriptional regulator [Polyangia bacterium]